MTVDRSKLPTEAETIGGLVLIGLFWLLGICFTVLPWLIGIAWMANHWLGVGG